MPRTALFRKAFALHELKLAPDDTAADSAGTFTGYLAVFNNVDLGDDVIEPGAFAKTLNDARERKSAQGGAYLFPILAQHDSAAPCGGFLEAREDSHGLWVKGQLDLDTQLGREVYSGLKKGYLSGLSIGYSAIKHKWVGDIRHLQEIALYEGSVVTFAMNPEAQVGAVKGASGKATWPLAPRGKAWDGGGAHDRIVAWATKDDGSLDTGKLESVHFWYDDAAPDKIGSYKLLFCDVVSGEVQAIPRGIFACAGSHGVDAADIPSGDVAGVKAKIEAYYARCAKEFDDDSIVAPWATSDGGKGANVNRRQRRAAATPDGQPVKALDFNAALQQVSADDQLQDDWGDSFQALVNALHSVMVSAVYGAGMGDDFDGQSAAEDVLSQFSAHMTTLVKQSLTAEFVPMLDDDGDSFLDPDGPNADCDDDGSMGMMSANDATRSQKSGRTLSADNHAMMTKALGMIGAGHQMMSEFVKSNAPDAASQHASAGNPNPTNPGNVPPSDSDNVYDPEFGFGKSQASTTSPYAHRAGALAAYRPAIAATTPAAQAGAGSASPDAGKATAATTQSGAANGVADDDIAQMRALLAQMRGATTAQQQPVAAQ